MSWGIKITALYLGFVGIILTMVTICFAHKTELESKDYYHKELVFQDQIDARTNADNLSVPIEYVVRARSVEIVLPKEVVSSDVKGNVEFVRPSDATLDKSIPIQTNDAGSQMISSDFTKGVYKMKLSFTSKGKSYFKEAIINFK